MLEEDIIDEKITVTCKACQKAFEAPMGEPDEEVPEICPSCPDLEKL